MKINLKGARPPGKSMAFMAVGDHSGKNPHNPGMLDYGGLEKKPVPVEPGKRGAATMISGFGRSGFGQRPARPPADRPQGPNRPSGGGGGFQQRPTRPGRPGGGGFGQR